MTLRLILAGVVGLACAGVAEAADPAMSCEWYVVGENGLKANGSTVAISADSSPEMEFRLTAGDGEIPVPTKGVWKVVWRSDDGMRVVSTLVDDNPVEWSRSPVHFLDVDFAGLRVKDTRGGGDLDFDEVIRDPWKTECRRTN